MLNIRIDAVRSLCEKINQTSQFGGYRIAILDEADKLTISAANSLLKTLEEPGQNVLILLVTSRTHRLPVTIRSRCQNLHVRTPEPETALGWIESKTGIDSERAAQALDAFLYSGSDRAARMLERISRKAARDGLKDAAKERLTRLAAARGVDYWALLLRRTICPC